MRTFWSIMWPVLVLSGILSEIAAGQPPPSGWGDGWQGVASPAEVAGAPTALAEPRRELALTVNGPKDEAELFIGWDVGQISGFAIRCGIAGTVGPIVWQPPTGSVSLDQRILSRDIISVDPQGPCGVRINNIVSLEAAARERRLYAEMEIGGVMIRGQLWPKVLDDSDVLPWALMSDQQAVGAGSAPLWLRSAVRLAFRYVTVAQQYGWPAELLYQIGNYQDEVLMQRHEFQSVTLYCGRPGENGEIVASLPDAYGALTSLDLFPTQAAGPCGMAVTNLASLVEASLRGNLYAVAVRIYPPYTELRGQFRSL